MEDYRLANVEENASKDELILRWRERNVRSVVSGLMGILSKALCFTREKLQGYFKFIKQMETTLYTAEFIWLIFGESSNFCVNKTGVGQNDTGG